MPPIPTRARLWFASTAAALAVLAVCLLSLGSPASANVDAAARSAAAVSSLPACPFWAAGITPPARSTTPWVPPLQTSPAVDFSARPAAPAITGALQNGQVTITVAPVPNAVAYKVWRDGVDIGYISYWGQTGPLTVTDTSPCQGAYYDVVAMYDTSNSDASLGRLSAPYWLGADGTIAPGAGSVPAGTQISMTVTSYDNTGQDASGYNAQLGVCATDPRVIPWGTYFTVPGYGTCYAADLGTWIQNDTVDVWLPGDQANNWGVQSRTVTVIADPYAGGPTPTASPTPSTSPTPMPTPTPSASASSSPSASPTPSPTGAGTCAAVWSASTTYTKGAVVSYGGENYTATYVSTDAVPGAPTSWAVWTANGPCTT
ncbi:3D domain-containing protein [Streptacidiphilus anmyonensis]|uniref:3D domain-containing protein n=1 Tax=Streptacidiphilus anmyonensis TaxID=405782 RepID=UPI000695017C|nr:3D domain-containing protein [Streptacidiphilus anmyonensis]